MDSKQLIACTYSPSMAELPAELAFELLERVQRSLFVALPEILRAPGVHKIVNVLQVHNSSASKPYQSRKCFRAVGNIVHYIYIYIYILYIYIYIYYIYVYGIEYAVIHITHRVQRYQH